MKRVNSRIARGSGGILGKYAKLMLVGYLFKKLKFKNITLSKHIKEVEPVGKAESNKKARGSLIMKIGTIIVGALVGATIIYAMKKFAAKKYLSQNTGAVC
jgi:hypothetical protein